MESTSFGKPTHLAEPKPITDLPLRRLQGVERCVPNEIGEVFCSLSPMSKDSGASSTAEQINLKTTKFVAVWRHLIAASGAMAVGTSLLFSCALAHADNVKDKPLPNSAATLSPRAKNFVSERWNNSSFANGIAIIADAQETATSRAAAMQMLHANRKKLTADEMRQLLSEATRLAKDVSVGETISAFAVNVMANRALTMNKQGQLSGAESKQEAGFLMATTTDSRREVHLRASAITALGVLKASEARGALRDLLTNSVTRDVPEVARPACLSLMRIDGERAIPDLANVLKSTSDVRVFGTAAFALGQLKRRECMAALVENWERFPDSGACDAALVDMEDVIFSVLSNPRDQNLSAAIQATRYLRREGQSDVYTPLLRNLLSAASVGTRRAAAERLLERASCLDFDSEKRELTFVSKAIGDQPELQAYQQRIRNRLSGSVVAPNTNSAVPAPSALKLDNHK